MSPKASPITKSKDGSVRGIRHGLSHTPEYIVFRGMVQRCYDPNSSHYHLYGKRGIKVCDRWMKDFATFYDDMGPRPSESHQIDRIDVNGDYEKSNCRWTTSTINNLNKRDYSNNKSGYKGVSFDKKSGKWRASIMRDRKQIHCGFHETPEEAYIAREKRLLEL